MVDQDAVSAMAECYHNYNTRTKQIDHERARGEIDDETAYTRLRCVMRETVETFTEIMDANPDLAGMEEMKVLCLRVQDIKDSLESAT